MDKQKFLSYKDIPVLDSRVLKVSGLPSPVYARTLHGAFFALLDYLDPNFAESLHGGPESAFSLYATGNQVEVGSIGLHWRHLLKTDFLRNVKWRVGPVNCVIKAVSERPVFIWNPSEMPFVHIKSIKPIILRGSDRKAVLNPGVADLLRNVSRRADLCSEAFSRVCEQIVLHKRIIKPVRTDYGFQREPAISAAFVLDLRRVSDEYFSLVKVLLQGADVIGLGCKTAMGYGQVRLSFSQTGVCNE